MPSRQRNSSSKRGSLLTSSLIVIAGPTAVGKGTVVKYLLEHYPGFEISISATTRPPRPTEVDGQDYFFVTLEEFEEMKQSGELLEWATVHGKHSYGTPKSPILRALAEGKKVILEIDIQGAKQVKQSMPGAKTIFIAPPSWDELVRRLESRGTETADQMKIRLETAKVELAQQDFFDHVITNDEVATCAQRIVELSQ